MRLSLDTQRSQEAHQAAATALTDGAASSRYGGALSARSARPSEFLTEGSGMVMRMARLLTYLLVDFEVPAVVKQAVRSARPFFFGLVDFSKLTPYETAALTASPSLKSEPQNVITC
jgi:hypothetical protein